MQAKMGRFQWRISFSRAKTVLLNSWTQVQQIVYHMLRFFLKTEQLRVGAIRTLESIESEELLDERLKSY